MKYATLMVEPEPLRLWPMVHDTQWCGEHPARLAAAHVAFGGELAALMADVEQGRG
jgi:hypothetical protein